MTFSIQILLVQPEPYEKADDGSCLVTGFPGGPFDGGGKTSLQCILQLCHGRLRRYSLNLSKA